LFIFGLDSRDILDALFPEKGRSRLGERKISPLYRLIKAAVRAVYPKIKVVGEENLPPEPVVYVGNHSQMNGPIACELYTPGEHYIWCAGEMMDKKEVPAYAYQDFWSEKPKAVRWFYKLLSYIIAPLSQLVFTNANTIGVYHDAKIITTFKKTVTALQEGASVVIFPEHHVPRNNIICEFQDRFIDVAKLYYKRTGKALAFVPDDRREMFRRTVEQTLGTDKCRLLSVRNPLAHSGRYC